MPQYIIHPIARKTGSPDNRRHKAGNLAYVKSILIVDDSPLIRRNLRNLLEQQTGLAVCGEAENGLDGIAKAQELNPNLIVLDLSMPVMNGLDAARKLKQLMPSVPLVMFTNHASGAISAEAMGAGIDCLTDKSQGSEVLVNTIQQLLHPTDALHHSA
jgi:DNA-binding NarL/FixJ family response regulator